MKYAIGDHFRDCKVIPGWRPSDQICSSRGRIETIPDLPFAQNYIRSDRTRFLQVKE
jgi:hypothetical protein